jgi:C-terminal peptidase prc
LLLLLTGSSHARAAGSEEVFSKSSIARQSPNELRAIAAAAEKAGDWEAAFSAYCRLFVLDRTAPGLRDKLNVAMRRAQQLRRHRDPQFQGFVAGTSVSDALNLFGEVFTKVPALYVDRDRSRPQQLWDNGVEELSRALADPVFRQAFLDGDNSGPPSDKLEAFRGKLKVWAKEPVNDSRSARAALRKLITSAQGAAEIRTPSALVFEMIYGSCNGLDEYTIFLNPPQVLPEAAASKPDLSAQGLYLGLADDGLVITGVAAGSWAALETQLRKGDRIIRLNGRLMDMTTPSLAAEAIRNPIDGRTHLLEIIGVNPEDGTNVVALPVIVPTVYRVIPLNKKDAVGYARIGGFGPTTPRELDEAIQLLKSRDGVRAMILDLRGNMGGSFLASVETAKRLIPSGVIVTTQGQLSEVANHPFSSDSGMTANDIPVVVLIDGETASAAEVFAAALKDHHRATLVGMPTFGKGAIQYPLKLMALDEVDDEGKPRTNRSGTVRLTIARLIAPGGGAINGVGISPHVFEADPERQLNTALEKAIELAPPSPRPN